MSMILAVSERDVDNAFAKATADHAGFAYAQASKAYDLKHLIKDHPEAFVFWDIDHPGATDLGHPISISKVLELLKAHSKPENVFVVSDVHLNQMPYIFSISMFNHHIFRRFGDPGPAVLAKVLKGSRSPDLTGVAPFLPEGTVVKKLTVQSSQHRKLVVEAMFRTLDQAGIASRLAQTAAQSIDELLMNAIFDAPLSNGQSYRYKQDRSAVFSLTEQEAVQIEFGVTSHYACVSVRDSFGSLKQETIFKAMKKNYVKKTYEMDHSIPSAGLGVYGILQSGISLVYICREGVRTEACLFFPTFKSMRAVRGAFRFLSLL